MLQQFWAMFRDLTGVAVDQLAISLEEIPDDAPRLKVQIVREICYPLFQHLPADWHTPVLGRELSRRR